MDLILLAGRSAASALGKILGPAAVSHWRSRKIRKILEEYPIGSDPDELDHLTDQLTVSQAARLHQLMDSIEVQNTAHKIASAQLTGRFVDEKDALLFELYEVVRLNLGITNSDTLREAVTQQLFDALSGSIASYIADANTHGLVSPESLARILPLAMHYGAATERNENILAKLAGLQAFDRFESKHSPLTTA